MMNMINRRYCKTRLDITGVFGYPVKHSLSPAMQNAAFKKAGLNTVYLPFAVKPAECAFLIKKLPALGITGINLTIPHKETGFQNVEYLSRDAKICRAVNTITVKNGKLYGTSTDGEGLLRALKYAAGLDIRNKSVIILGAGGAGRSAGIYLAVKGAKRIIIANRTADKALSTVKLIKKAAPKVEAFFVPLKESVIRKYCTGSELIINATSLGLRNTDRPVLGPKAFRKNIIFYDMIYNPAMTATMRAAKRGGANVYNGLSMLLFQGALSWELWTGKKAPLQVMEKALSRNLFKE